MAGIFFIDGTVEVKIEGEEEDSGVITDVDSMVSVVQKQEQKIFKGASVVAKEAHTINQDCTIKIQKCPFTKEQLAVLCGIPEDVTSTLADDVTVSTKYSVSSTPIQRPLLNLLIKGSDDLTGKKVEVLATRCKLVNDFDFSMAVGDFALQELEFLVLKPTIGDYVSLNFEN